MIYGNINFPELYDFLPKNFKLCFDFIKNHDLSEMELKTYELDGEKVFMMLTEFVTAPVSERSFEAHKNYCDIHYIVSGSERIDFGFTDRMTAGAYKPDIMTLTGKESGSVVLQEGDFLICMPRDGHKPGIADDSPEKIRKATFKVLFEA